MARYPAEFRERAVELARLREKPVKQLAADLGISDQTLHNWLNQADIGLLGSMGRVGSAYDNAMTESFFGTLQRELLDRRQWATRKELASAIFEWIEAWYNPRRRRTSIENLSPVNYECLYNTAVHAA
jgi:putative transposase